MKDIKMMAAVMVATIGSFGTQQELRLFSQPLSHFPAEREYGDRVLQL